MLAAWWNRAAIDRASTQIGGASPGLAGTSLGPAHSPPYRPQRPRHAQGAGGGGGRKPLTWRSAPVASPVPPPALPPPRPPGGLEDRAAWRRRQAGVVLRGAERFYRVILFASSKGPKSLFPLSLEPFGARATPVSPHRTPHPLPASAAGGVG